MGKKKHTEETNAVANEVNVAEEVRDIAEEVNAIAEEVNAIAEEVNAVDEEQTEVEVVEAAEAADESEATEESEKNAETEATEETEVTEEAEATDESEVTDESEATEEAEATEEVEMSEDKETTEAPSDEVVATTKKKKGWIIALAIVGVLLLAAIGVYLGFAKHYEERFFLKTSVNGADCAGLTVEEVEAMMQEQVEQYVLTVIARNDVTQEIKASDIGIKFNGINVIQDAFAAQNPYLWFTGLYEEEDIKAEIDFTYDEEKLNAVIAGLDCLKTENQVAPVSAKPVYQDGAYVIQEETYGTQLNAEQVTATVIASVDNMEASVDLDQAGCYVNPTYTKDSKEVISAVDALNQCLKTNVTYSIDGITVNVNAATVAPWISVDAEMNLVIDAGKVRAFTNTLGSKYNIADSDDTITTPTGKETSVPGGRLGRVVGAAAECDKLIGEIKAGAQVTREPIFSQNKTPDGVKSWGNTYIEVDLSAQHMWYIVDGAVKFESDVVTGKPDGSHNTPAGKFQILEKLSPKTLRGYYPNGQLEYRRNVKYWARITWSGIGFHDATWQAEFGGTRYKDGYGSHGCINMPYGKIAELYGMINKGTAVVIHY